MTDSMKMDMFPLQIAGTNCVILVDSNCPIQIYDWECESDSTTCVISGGTQCKYYGEPIIIAKTPVECRDSFTWEIAEGHELPCTVLEEIMLGFLCGVEYCALRVKCPCL